MTQKHKLENSILLVIGLIMVMMAAVSVSADELRENSVPSIYTDGTDNGSGSDEPPLIAPAPDDGQMVIAPNPTSGDVSNSGGNDNTFTLGVPVLGAIAGIGVLAVILVILWRKK
jgi:hypothetical protein